MFICGKCNKLSKPGETSHLVVLETRSVTYPARVYTRKGEKVVDPGGKGIEVTREIRVHESCI